MYWYWGILGKCHGKTESHIQYLCLVAAQRQKIIFFLCDDYKNKVQMIKEQNQTWNAQILAVIPCTLSSDSHTDCLMFKNSRTDCCNVFSFVFHHHVRMLYGIWHFVCLRQVTAPCMDLRNTAPSITLTSPSPKKKKKSLLSADQMSVVTWQ